MDDPKQPPAPDPAPGATPPEHPHGVVEEIREEIEHAVENVPKPVRWTVRKLVLLAGLSLVGLIVLGVVSALLYLSHRTELVAQELTLFLNGTLARRTDLAIEIGDIRGDPLHRIHLIEPRVRFRDGDGPPLLQATSVQLSYSIWGLLRSGVRAIDVQVESPVVRLTKLPSGHLRLPLWKTEGATTAKVGRFDVRLLVHHGRLVSAGPQGRIDDVELEAWVSSGAQTRVAVRNLSWSKGWYGTRQLKMRGEMTAGDSVRFTVTRLETPDLALSASGGWKKGESKQWVHAEVERVRWGWIAEASGNRTFAVPGQGQATVDAVHAGGWSGRFVSALEWRGLPARGNGSFTWMAHRLAIEPLFVHCAGGDLDGKMSWSKPAWEIGGAVRNGDPSHWSAIGIDGWPEGRLNGSFRYAVDSRGKSSAELRATLGSSEIARWRVDQAEVAVHFPAFGPDSFEVHMQRAGGEATLLGRTDDAGWHGRYTAARFPLEEWPDGQASGIHGTLAKGEGTVEGRSGGRLFVTGVLSGTGTDWLGAKMARWRLDDVRGLLLPKPDLTATGRLEHMLFLGVHFDSVRAGGHLQDQTLALSGLRANAGDTLVTADGTAWWSESGWGMSLDRAEAASPHFAWVAEPPMRFVGDKTGVGFDRFVAHDSGATLEITGRWAAPGGAFDWSARTRGLDLSRLGLPDELGLGGHAEGRLLVRGLADHPRWSLEAECSQPAWQGGRADSLALSLEGAPGEVEIHRARFMLGGGTVQTEATIDRTTHPWPDSLTGTAVTRWLASAERWSGNVAVNEFPLAQAAPARGWSGRLSGRMTLGGSPARPDLDATAEARPLVWHGYEADGLRAHVVYHDDRLSVPELTMRRRNLSSTIKGQMPLKLGLGVRPEVPELPMSWELEVPNGDLSVVPQFVPQIASAGGRLGISARIGGTPRHPDLDGTLSVRDGQLRLAGRDETINHLDADCRLDESRITLDSLTARQGERGRVQAKGVIDLSGSGLKGYHFDLKMREFTAVETGVYVAEFDGDFTVTNGPKVGTHVLPFVAGSMDLRHAVVLFDFANQSEVQRIAATTQPLFWTYRVQVNATNNLKWQPPDGDIEFSANLEAEQTPERLTMDGEMKALRGTYYFLSNRFTVNQADLTFRSVDGANPEIVAEATTRVVPSKETTFELGSSTDTRSETHTVTVRIKGKSTEPVIEFASDPSDWDEARILRELTVGRFYAKGVALGDPLDNYLTRAINKTLSAEMSRAFRGYVSEWELQREQGGILVGQGDVILGVGTQLTPNLALRFRQRVPGLGREQTRLSTTTASPFERDVEAEYRINRFFFITSELTQRRTLTGSTSTVSGSPDFNVNFKARWEY